MVGGPAALVVVGDSVARNYLSDVADDYAASLPEERAAPAFPSLLARLLTSSGSVVELREHTRIAQHVGKSLSRIDDMDFSDARLVVIAHGGLEAVLFPPHLLRRLPCLPDPPPALVARQSSTYRLLDAVRRPVWRGLCRAMARRPRLTSRVLRRAGFVHWWQPEEYETTLVRLLAAVRERTVAPVVVLQSPRSARFSRLLADPGVFDLTDEAAVRAAENVPGVTVCLRPPEMSEPWAFLPDGFHLSARGHLAVATALHRASSATAGATDAQRE